MDNLNKQLRLDIEEVLAKKGVTGKVDMDRVAERIYRKLLALIPVIVTEALIEEIRSAGKIRPCAYYKRGLRLCQLNGGICDPNDCQAYRPMRLPKLLCYRLQYRLRVLTRMIKWKGAGTVIAITLISVSGWATIISFVIKPNIWVGSALGFFGGGLIGMGIVYLMRRWWFKGIKGVRGSKENDSREV